MKELAELITYLNYAMNIEKTWTAFIGLDIDNSVIYLVIVFAVSAMAIVGMLVVESMRQKISTGKEGLVGKQALVRSDFKLNEKTNKLQGQVLVMGEIWRAEMKSQTIVSPTIGEQFVVVAVEDGLTLILE